MEINFYYVHDEYIAYLKSVEHKSRGFTCVPNTQYRSRNKFLFGACFEKNGINYFVPVSHQIKHTDNDIVIKTKPKKGKSLNLGSLRFAYMIPVPKKCLFLLDIKNIPEYDQKRRINDELSFCRRNIHKIKQQAQKTYIAVSATKSEALKRNSCDFKLLETAYIIYCQDNDLPLSEELQKRYAEITGNKPTKDSSISVQTPSHDKPQPPQKSKSNNTFSFSTAQLKANAKRIHEQAENDSTPTHDKNKNKSSH